MARRTLTDEEIMAQFRAASRRAEIAMKTEPHAHAARYLRRRRILHIDLTNGSAFEVPVDAIEALRGAPDRDLAQVEVSPFGVAVHWEKLDADHGVAFLAELALGRKTLLRAAGAAGGSARSAAKTRAARLNGRKGGRPRKTAVTKGRR
jgi:hypothetical protein